MKLGVEISEHPRQFTSYNIAPHTTNEPLKWMWGGTHSEPLVPESDRSPALLLPSSINVHWGISHALSRLSNKAPLLSQLRLLLTPALQLVETGVTRENCEVIKVLQRCQNLHHFIHRGARLGIPAEAAVCQLGYLLYTLDGVVQLKPRIYYLVHLPLVCQVRPGPCH